MSVSKTGATTRPPPPTIPEQVTNLLQKTDPSNDYAYYGRPYPGGSAPLFGQQYRFDVKEAQDLVKSLEVAFPDAADRVKALEVLNDLTTRDQSQGGVAFLTPEAGDELTLFARRNGSDLRFGASTIPPNHPVG